MAADGQVINNEQAREVWAGTTFGFAALLISEGMRDEGYKSAWGLYHVIYESKGYWFRTPEAWDITGNFRASMYMRPTGIWAMEMTQPPPKPQPGAEGPEWREVKPAVGSRRGQIRRSMRGDP
jgi:non-lysosomal glucosylceramidase